MSNVFKGVIRLRRDNEYNYNKIKDTFIPANGEICLVDTPKDGLRAVCGDGFSTFAQLSYLGDLIIHGYYFNEKFYEDKNYTIEISGSTRMLYVDATGKGIFYHNGEKFLGTETAPAASSITAGIMKLYSTTGSNEDGTMTQKAITDELDDKIEIALNESEELLIFTT